jgi:protein kinase-like protein
MRICPACGEAYGETVTRCELDGVALGSWEAASRVARAPTVPATEERLDDPTEEESAELTATRPAGGVRDGEGETDTFDLAETDQPASVPTEDTYELVGGATRAVGPVRRRPGSSLTVRPASGPRPIALGDEETDAAAPPTEVAPEPVPGRLLGGRYLLRRRLAIGGFGAVFEASDRRLEKRVAVKVLSPHVAGNREMLTRFRREAIAASAVGHEGIVAVTDFDRDADGTYFIAMELLDGRDLADLIAGSGPLAPGRALTIAAGVADALDCAHHRGILHRDLKPANVFVLERSRGDLVKVIDFGISKLMRRGAEAMELTRSGQVVGTPYYMAPEQAQGRAAIDGRADVYALGVILYEMLVGEPPFVGENYLEVAFQHVIAEPVAPSLRGAGTGKSLDRLVLRALAKSPEERFLSMAQFSAAILDELAAIDPGAAAVVRARQEHASPAARRPSAAVVDPAARRRRPSTLRYSSGQLGSVDRIEAAAAVRSPWRIRGLAAMVAAGGLVALMLATADRGGTATSSLPAAQVTVRQPDVSWCGRLVAATGVPRLLDPDGLHRLVDSCSRARP